ncbi:DUF4352 domain-containing protein [Goodfellowiella coeruleoviolacea]|uniref:DUF4352 domain-containing protein n=1 Tax=Goodfellowiella coeruleoviolacea TaxID=334858 RepID=A0AAE3GA12_9PSEU|nr:DUF4352 domain-containing protein [Goodfellowiella coeruleoviolacea]MCP2164431.1 protein of unknown function (DUF4352) [Goodfellowiella coeruleoviolacea]
MSLAVVALGLAGCGSSVTGSAKTAQSTGQAEQSSTGAAQDAKDDKAAPAGDQEVAFGEKVVVKQDSTTEYSVTIGAPEEVTEKTDFPPEGRYVSVAASAALTDGVLAVVSEDDFVLVDSQGKKYEPTPAGLDLENAFIHMLGTVGETKTGTIFYDVPTGAKGFSVVFTPTDNNEKPVGVTATWK